MAQEVLQSATQLPGGIESIAADGESVALYVRALSATGQVESARAIAKSTPQDVMGRVAIELELADLDLQADQLALVERRLAQSDGTLRPEFANAARSRYLLGRSRVRAGNATSAREPLESFVTRWPLHRDAPAAWHMLAQEAIERRDLDRARECRERGAEQSRWHAYYNTRRLQRRADPDAAEPRIGLAQLWIAAEDWERARAELTPVLEEHPEVCSAWTTLGELERKQGRAAESRAAYVQAIECDPEASVARYALGLMLIENGEAEAGRDQLLALCDSTDGSDRRFLGAHLALARALIELGDETAAAQRYARFRELGGNEPLQPQK